MTMATWRARKMRKAGKASRTPGKQKGVNCKATMIEKYLARAGRSYKHPKYSQWLKVKPGVTKPTRSIGGE